MAYPTRLLAADEDVVLDLRPHWKRIVLPALLVPIVVGAASYGVFALPENDARPWLRWALLAIAVLVLLRFSFWPFLTWQTTQYVLTTRRVVIRRGVLSRSGRDVPLTRVNDVSFSHTLFERMLGCGTLTIESAGEHGQVVLTEVPRVQMVQREVYRCAEEESRRMAAAD